jgi:G6PDH family F420-dependent oxidoreductase
MVTIGYFLSSEEHPGSELVRAAAQAEQAGFSAAWISDHYHPWLDDQGQSPFVWSVLGAIAQATSSLRVTTAVTAPIMRIHPAILAQAAATTAELFGPVDGRSRFGFGVGTGEALNEHILGDHWPIPEVRLAMLEEAVALIRELWKGESVDHDGEHYVVENARLYTLPAKLPPILVSGFGAKAIEVAARIADGFITTQPNKEHVDLYRQRGGAGPALGGVKVCWNEDAGQAVKIAHRSWRSSFVPGQLSQDLPTPSHFEAASQLVTEEMVAEKMPCGPDPEVHLKAIRAYVDAGFDEVYVSQMGPDQEGMIRFYEREILPNL